MILCSSCFSEAGFATATALEPQSTCANCGESCLGYITPPVPSTGVIGLKQEHRTIQDEEVKDMIEFLQTSGMGRVIMNNIVAMLEELLLLRKKVRDAAC